MTSSKDIGALFDHIATQYDQVLNTLSLRQHRYWQQQLIDHSHIRPNHRILDIATGTGAVACAIAAQTKMPEQIVGCDISIGMLHEAKKRHPDIQWVHAAAEELPFPDASFDRIVISLAFRFMQQKKVLSECHRLLKTSGRLTILDSSPWPMAYRPLIGLFDHTIGSLISLYYFKKARIYEPVYASIQDNIDTETLLRYCQETQFSLIEWHRLTLNSASLYRLIKI